MIHTLYKSINNRNGKFYVGVHSTNDVGFGTEDWKDPYVGSGKSILRALKKYGRGCFDVEVIAYFDNEDYAYDAERDLITEDWIQRNKNVYNMVVGGGKPPKTTKESARKSHLWRLQNGIYQRPPSKNFLATSFGNKWGSLLTNETREKRRQNMILRNKVNNPMKSLENRKRLSERNKMRKDRMRDVNGRFI